MKEEIENNKLGSISDKYKPKKAEPALVKVSPVTSNFSPEHDHLFNLRLIGDSGVGKSCLLLRYADETYTESHISTIGIDFKVKRLEVENKKVALQIWDTAGQERFRTIQSTYDSGAHAILLIFDKTNQASFNNIKKWYKENETNYPKALFVLVGTKDDLSNKSVVDYKTAREYADNLGIIYTETSAKTGVNVKELFTEIAKLLLEQLQKVASYIKAVNPTPSPPPARHSSPAKNGFFCCCGFGDEENEPIRPSKR